MSGVRDAIFKRRIAKVEVGQPTSTHMCGVMSLSIIVCSEEEESAKKHFVNIAVVSNDHNECFAELIKIQILYLL